MKAETEWKLEKAWRARHTVDSWHVTKASSSSVVKVTSTIEEMRLMDVVSDISTMNPVDILIMMEDESEALEW